MGGHEKQEELCMEERGPSAQPTHPQDQLEFKSWFYPTVLWHDLSSY